MPGGAGYQYQQSGGGAPPNKPGSGGYDGPPSSFGEPSRGPNPFGSSLGFDPAKSKNSKSDKKITNTRIDLPAFAHSIIEENHNVAFSFPTALPDRPGTNTAGKPIQVRVNQFKVLQWPTEDIYQYDISFGEGAEKRGKIMAVWKSSQLQRMIKEGLADRGPFIWDGNKIGWCKFQLPAVTIHVDLDKEKNPPRAPRAKPDICRVQIRPSATIRMAVIGAYLNRQIPFDNSILESINLLDHILRQGPSNNYTAIKRSFFSHGNVSIALDDCLLALKGVYSSMRLCNPRASVTGKDSRGIDIPASTGLAINVDVANGTFWTAQDLHQCARNYLRHRNPRKSYEKMIELLYPVPDNKHNGITMSEDFKNLRKLIKLRFKVKHRQKGDDNKTYSIKKFTFGIEPKYHANGMNAKNTLFKWKNKDKHYAEEEISVYNYFKKVYDINLTWWQLPLVCTEKGGMFPMECCTLIPHQRYMYKLSPEQGSTTLTAANTAAMIKFAVTRPNDRIKSIRHGIEMLNWAKDKYLAHFGIKVDTNMTETKARLLQPPEIQFGGGAKVNPGTSGRWDLRGKKFFLPNPKPLVSWGFVVLQNCVPEPAVRNFINVFIQTYVGHGGIIQNKNPLIYYQQNRNQPYDDVLFGARAMAGNQANSVPQILFVVLHGRDSQMYDTLKKNMDCRWAMVSQFLNMAHVLKAQPQYCSNVAMKVNAKLGGTTSKVIELKDKPLFTASTMIIGADVSHASAGSQQGSMAAITVSMDKSACRYAAAVETNGARVEMITKENCKSMLGPLFQQWCRAHNGPPDHIYYFRDGVSEGQFTQVLDQEVAHMKEAIMGCYPTVSEEMKKKLKAIKWTVTVCTKRHHIRIFPKEGDTTAGDRNNNPLPGVLIENDITHPFEFDFYLNSHSAIQGTARPVHYQVILDEINIKVNQFQQMIYHHCYQYMRSTTPVSLFPAVYYAHLASNRARSHEATPSGSGPRGGQKFEELQQDLAVAASNARNAAGRARTAAISSQTGASQQVDIGPLLPMGGPDNMEQATIMRTSMWYI